MDKINIYCLYDPRTRKPFYVGATRSTISIRLSGHINEVKTYLPKFWSAKQKFMHQMIQEGVRPKARLLLVATLHSVDHYEQFFHTMLILQGYELLQLTSAFHYKRKFLSERLRHQSYNKHLQICCKNTFNYIW